MLDQMDGPAEPRVDDLLYELRLAGFAVRQDGERLLVSPAANLTPALAARIKAGKTALLAALGVWDQSEADKLVDEALALRERHGYDRHNPERAAQQVALCDRIDRATEARDMAGLRAAVHEAGKVFPSPDPVADWIWEHLPPDGRAVYWCVDIGDGLRWS